MVSPNKARMEPREPQGITPLEVHRGTAQFLTNAEKVRQFHELFNHPAPTRPTLPDPALFHLRRVLIEEELGEIWEAWDNSDMVEFADGVADLLYVVYGLGVVAGLPVDRLFAVVHDSNLSKLDADGNPVPHPTIPGKIGKSDLFEPPTEKIKEILNGANAG